MIPDSMPLPKRRARFNLHVTNRVVGPVARQLPPDEVRARKSQDIPLRRYGEPEEFGRVAAFLRSPRRLVCDRRDGPR